jgi:hypothetical protein
MLGGDGAARDLVERDGRGHRGVERLARDRDPHPPPAGGDHVVRQAGALGADEQREPAVHRRERVRERLAPVRVQRHPRARQLLDPGVPRHRHREQRTHRRPHGLRPVRVRAARPERDRRGAERQRRAQDGADVARIRDPVQRHAQRPDGRVRPALLEHGERARPRAQPRDGRQQLRLELHAVEPAAGRAVALERRPAGSVRRRQQVLALGDEAARQVAVAPPRELADLLQSVVVR